MITETYGFPQSAPGARTGLNLKSLRAVKRGILVGFSLLGASLDHLWFVRRKRNKANAARRAWLKRTAQRILRAMDVRVRFEGHPPRGGLLVSNHLSYLDILVFASVAPAIFVSKSEVGTWPVFGWLARCAGTIFITRQNRGDVARVGEEIERALECGGVVILFPEGTSSNGRSVLPFHSSLLNPVLRNNYPVSTAALDYQLSEGSVEREVCYWGDMMLGPHLLNLLSKDGIQAIVRFGGRSPQGFRDRKQMAIALHKCVSNLRVNHS